MSAGRLDTARLLWAEAKAKGRYRGACEKIPALLVDEHDHRLTAAEVHRSGNRSRDLEKLLPRTSVLEEVRQECVSQDEKWGAIRDYPDGTGPHWKNRSYEARKTADTLLMLDQLSWPAILREEVFEVFAEMATDRLRAELIQVAAVCVNWIMALDRRKGGE